MTTVLRAEDVRFVRDRRALLGPNGAGKSTLLNLVSACFDHPITIEKAAGRWTARAS